MSIEINLGSSTIDSGKLVRQLKYDLRDDWYPDSLGYEDLLESEVVAEAITSAIDRNDGLFQSEGRAELNVPKQGFVLRYSLETSLLDRAYYHALVSNLIPFYDELFPPQVLNHRYAITGKRAGRYLYRHPIESWNLFEGYVLEDAKRKPVILVTDILNYYENINIDLLIQALKDRVPTLNADGSEKAKIRNIIEDLNRCLKEWSYQKEKGLPQNRDASSFLASFMLLAIDEKMLAYGYSYYRYMDDIRIATTSRYQARAALQNLIVELRMLGLNVNGSKTKILEPENPEYKEILLQKEPVLEQVDHMWKSCSLPVIRRSFEPLSCLATKLIAEGQTQKRAFRFCIKRFENLALCSEIDVPDEFFTPLIDAAILELDSQPCSTDQLVRFLKAAPMNSNQLSNVANFLKDKERAIYDWQNYLLWQLLVYKGHQDNDLLKISRVRTSESRLHADRAGATLYTGAMGSGDDRQNLATHFKDCKNYLLQRNGIIAVHELKFNSGVKQNVAPHVLPSLKGTYMRIRERFKGCYHRPLPAVSYSNIYDEVTSYD